MTLYFNAAVDYDWATLGNWWQDEDCTIPATALPAPADDVVILVTVGSLGAARTVSSATVPGSLSFADYVLTVTNGATFFGGGYINAGCIVNANCVFNDGSENGGIINGNAVFNDFSANYYYINTQINGNAVFNDNSRNYAMVNGNAVFNHNSYMEEDGSSYYGYVSGDAFFYDNSYNKGYVGGVTNFCSPSALTAQLTQASYDRTFFEGGIKYPFADILGAGLI
jgi:hypothetical protein